MISQEEIGFKSSRESKFSPPKQRASSQAAAAVSGGLIFDPASRSLRYPKLGGPKTSEKKAGANVVAPIQGSSGGVGKRILAGADKAIGGVLCNADGGLYEHQSADDSSPRCVITNSTLESSTSTSPSGSKSVSEMDDYSDVKQLIAHNRSSSPSDADDDAFFGSSNGPKGLASSGFRCLDTHRGANLDNPPRLKNVKANGELGQKIYGVTASHSRSISTSAVPVIDSFQKLAGKDCGQQDTTLEIEPVHVNLNSTLSNHISTSDIGPLLDPGSGPSVSKMKTKGATSYRGSQSHELLSLNESGWSGGAEGHSTTHLVAGAKNSPLDPILESLMKASISREGQIKQQNQIAEKIEEIKRKNGVHSSNINNSIKSSVQSSTSSFLPGGTGAFSFNQTHVVRVNDADFLDYDSNYDSVSNSSFDFNRGDMKGVHRTVLNNLTKPAPSKWDDAEKWLSSEPPMRTKSKSGPQGHVQGAALALSKKAAFLNQAGRLIPNITQLAKLSSTGVNSAVPDASASADAGAVSNDGDERTKKVDTMKFIEDDQEGEGGTQKFAFMPASGDPALKTRTTAGSLDRYPLEDLFGRDNGDAKEGSTSPDAPLLDLDPALRTEKPTSDSPPKEDLSEIANPGQPSSPRDSGPKVCMRDMGTAMTPIASVEPSRAPTPVSARTPSMRSPSSSRPATPSRVVPTSSPTCETEKKVHYTDKELQSKTRQEILALGTQLGKHNIAAWATKEEEEEDAFKSLKSNVDLEEVRKVVIATRAAAWEEAEQAKYMARYKREEAKIQAWENHEKAKAEAEMRRIEMKIERMRSHANEKLMNKLAATRRSAEELRAAAAARRGEQASKTSQRAEYIRRTGKVPGSMFASLCCS